MTKIQKSNQDNNTLNFWIKSHDKESIVVGSDLCPDFVVCKGKFECYLWDIGICGECYCEECGTDYAISLEDILEDEADANEWLDEWLSALMPGKLTPESFESFCKVVECDHVVAPLPSFDIYASVEGEQRPLIEELNYLLY